VTPPRINGRVVQKGLGRLRNGGGTLSRVRRRSRPRSGKWTMGLFHDLLATISGKIRVVKSASIDGKMTTAHL